MADKLLDRWSQIKREMKALQTEELQIKKRFAAAMAKKQVSEIATQKYKLTSKTIHRESLSKKDCPKEVWQSHCKRSSYTIFRLTPLAAEEDTLEEEIPSE